MAATKATATPATRERVKRTRARVGSRPWRTTSI
jgi:hypothetical protein